MWEIGNCSQRTCFEGLMWPLRDQGYDSAPWNVCHAAAHSSCQLVPMRCGRYWHQRAVLERKMGLLLATALAPSRLCQDLQAVQPPASRLGCWISGVTLPCVRPAAGTATSARSWRTTWACSWHPRRRPAKRGRSCRPPSRPPPPSPCSAASPRAGAPPMLPGCPRPTRSHRRSQRLPPYPPPRT